MKNLKQYINEQLLEGLGFTVDDELATDYIYAFENNDWNSSGRNLKDIDMWWSLGTQYMKYVLEQSKFSGCLGEDTDELEVVKFEKFDSLFLDVCDVVSNAEGGKVPISDDWGHYVICYKGHDPIYIQDLDVMDWNDVAYAINPRAKWRNCVSKTNLEWILSNNDDTIWIRNRSSYNSLIKYTGWSIWKDGKCEAGRLAMEKK